MINWVEEYIKREEAIKCIVSSDVYINWLRNFMLNKNKLIDDDQHYYSDRITYEDREKIDLLSVFFDGIDYYADENGVYPLLCDSGIYYNIRYNDFFFKIGVVVGDANYTFCERSFYNKKINYIDFSDIIETSKSKKRARKK